MATKETIDVNGGILVGHDGSAAATAALRTAIRCAAAFGPNINVVRAWNLSTAPLPASIAPGYVPPFEDFEAATLTELERDVSAVRDEHPEAAITCSVVHGSAAEKLIEASPGVELIVVGSRGHGGFAGLLLGSVSEKVVRHARCRVLVDRRAESAPSHSEGPDLEQLERALASELKVGE